MEHLYAVFTGDIIGSSKASPGKLEATMANLASTAEFLGEFTGEATRFTRYRGDGWQLVLSPAFYLRALALIQARLKADKDALSTRIGIGLGTVENLGTSDLSNAKGQAFEYSGRALDSLTRDHSMKLYGSIRSGHSDRSEGLYGVIKWSDAAMLPMFSFITHRWTPAQAEAMALRLENDAQTQDEIAAKLGITRQAFNLRLTGAGYGPIREAIKLTEQYFADTTSKGKRTHD